MVVEGRLGLEVEGEADGRGRARLCARDDAGRARDVIRSEWARADG